MSHHKRQAPKALAKESSSRAAIWRCIIHLLHALSAMPGPVLPLAILTISGPLPSLTFAAKITGNFRDTR
jgi:hypothetical protein